MANTPPRDTVVRFSTKTVTFVLGPLLLIFCLLIPNSEPMLEAARLSGAAFPEGPKIGLGVLLWTATWWIGEATPLGLAAFIPTIIFCLSGLVAWKDALASFADPLVWVFMGGFLFAHAFKVWKLDERVALTLTRLSKTDNPQVAGFFVACLPVFFLTITGSITASTSIVYGLVLSFLAKQGFKQGSRYGAATLLALAQASTAGALIFLTSTPPNLIAKKTIAAATGVNLTFFDWFIVGSTHAIIGLILTWLIVYAMIKPEVRKLPFTKASLRQELQNLPSMSKGEKMTLVLLSLTIVLWTLPGILAIFASDSPSIAPISETVSRLLPEAAPAVLVMILFPLLRSEGRPLINWKEALTEAINWDVIFLLGGGLALGLGLNKSGFSLWIGTIFKQLAGGAPSEWTVYALSTVLAFILSYPASNTAAASVACPLAASIAQSVGVNPIPAILGAAIASSVSSSLPSTTPPMAIVYSSGYIRMRDMFKVGIVCDLLRLLAILAFGYPLSKYLLALKGIG